MAFEKAELKVCAVAELWALLLVVLKDFGRVDMKAASMADLTAYWKVDV